MSTARTAISTNRTYALISQIAQTAHYLTLYLLFPANIYAVYGSFFSLLYLTVALINLQGIDAILYTEPQALATLTRTQYIRILAIPQGIASLCGGALATIGASYWLIEQRAFELSHTQRAITTGAPLTLSSSPAALILLCCLPLLIASESARSLFRQYGHATGHGKSIAKLDATMAGLYAALSGSIAFRALRPLTRKEHVPLSTISSDYAQLSNFIHSPEGACAVLIALYTLTSVVATCITAHRCRMATHALSTHPLSTRPLATHALVTPPSSSRAESGDPDKNSLSSPRNAQLVTTASKLYLINAAKQLFSSNTLTLGALVAHDLVLAGALKLISTLALTGRSILNATVGLSSAYSAAAREKSADAAKLFWRETRFTSILFSVAATLGTLALTHLTTLSPHQFTALVTFITLYNSEYYTYYYERRAIITSVGLTTITLIRVTSIVLLAGATLLLKHGAPHIPHSDLFALATPGAIALGVAFLVAHASRSQAARRHD